MSDSRISPTCWILSDGAAGMENQCLGLAERLGLVPDIKRIALRAPWGWLPPAIGARRFAAPLAGIGDRQAAGLVPPWPDLLIATGRRTVGVSVAIRRQSVRLRTPPTLTVQIQNPRFPVSAFDLVVVPAHDQLTGPNVLTTRGSLHRVTRARLDAAAADFAAQLADLPRPLVTVLIGGPNSAYRMTPEVIERLCAGLRELAATSGAGFAVTASRRTGDENIAALRRGLAAVPHQLWDGQGEGENPYFGYLGLADAIIVTGDSVNMVTEACAAAKPVYVYDLPGGSAKFDRFHAAMLACQAVRKFVPGKVRQLESWTLPDIDDTGMVAAAVQRLLAARGKGQAIDG